MKPAEREARIYLRASIYRLRTILKDLPDGLRKSPADRETAEELLALPVSSRTAKSTKYRTAKAMAEHAMALLDGVRFKYVAVPDEALRSGFSPDRAVLSQLLLFDADARSLRAQPAAYRLPVRRRPDGKDIETFRMDAKYKAYGTRDSRTLREAGATKVSRVRASFHTLWIPESEG